jgi:hypothetical protein
MNLTANTVTINRGMARKTFGLLLIGFAVVSQVGLARGGQSNGWLLTVCLLAALVGAAMMSPTDRLKLDFVNRRYLRTYGWFPFLHLRSGSFDDLDGISIRRATRGDGDVPERMLRVLFLNWTAELPAFELATYDEAAYYSVPAQPLVAMTGEIKDGFVSGVVAAELRAEEFRERFGFHRMTPP